MLRSMVKNFSDKVRGVDLAIDYKHDSDDVAAGWINSIYLANEDQELWANVKWTPNGRQVLSDKEFRYLSADFHLNFQNNETNVEYGPTLFGAGLTNRPFIKDMKPVINLSEKMKGAKMDEKDKMIAELKAQIEALKKQEVVEDAAEGEAPMAMADMKKQNADLQAQCADMKKKLEEYQASAAEAEKAKVLSEKNASFDKLMVAGKAVEAQREHFMTGDTVKFAEAFVKPNLEAAGSTESPAPVIALDAASAQKKILELAEVKLSENKDLKMGEAIRLVLSENKELLSKYQG